MAELSPCSSIKSTSTALYDSDYSEEEFDTDSQKELQSLITKLESSVTSEQIYETLLIIRSDYSNVEDPTTTGKYHFMIDMHYIRKSCKVIIMFYGTHTNINSTDSTKKKYFKPF